MLAIVEKVKAKADRPETMREATAWTVFKNHYVALGLCHVCAAQAAYGHQIGFTRINQPCPDCADVVAGFPDGAANGWRSQSYEKARKGAYERRPERKAYTSAPWPTAVAHTPRREVSRGMWGPRSWELCYRTGGPREGLYEDDHAAFERLAAEGSQERALGAARGPTLIKMYPVALSGSPAGLLGRLLAILGKWLRHERRNDPGLCDPWL